MHYFAVDYLYKFSKLTEVFLMKNIQAQDTKPHLLLLPSFAEISTTNRNEQLNRLTKITSSYALF
jgi:hypothetical protein